MISDIDKFITDLRGRDGKVKVNIFLDFDMALLCSNYKDFQYNVITFEMFEYLIERIKDFIILKFQLLGESIEPIRSDIVSTIYGEIDIRFKNSSFDVRKFLNYCEIIHYIRSKYQLSTCVVRYQSDPPGYPTNVFGIEQYLRTEDHILYLIKKGIYI